MNVPGGSLEVVEVSLDDGGFDTGVISASRLYGHFDFECVAYDVSLLRVWPVGPYILVRFRSTLQLWQVFPVLTVRQLRFVCLSHGSSLPHVAVKLDYTQYLTSHHCDSQCSKSLTFAFKTRKMPRREQRVSVVEELEVSRFVASTESASAVTNNQSSVVSTDSVHNMSSQSNNVDGTRTYDGMFPFFPSREFRYEMIQAWQERMHASSQLRLPCAVCGQRFKCDDLRSVEANSVHLSCLRNEFLPAFVIPTTYDFILYDRAILCPAGLDDPWLLCNMKMCMSCFRSVVDEQIMPVDALTNFQYYELPLEVIEAFRQASMFDLMLVARARATRISFLLNEKSGFSGDSRVCQGFVKGNVAVLPQDTLTLRTVIPPDRGEIRDAMYLQ